MYYGTKRQTVPKGRRHVLYLHIVVMFTLDPTPLLESLQRPHGTTAGEVQATGIAVNLKWSRSSRRIYPWLHHESPAEFQ